MSFKVFLLDSNSVLNNLDDTGRKLMDDFRAEPQS